MNIYLILFLICLFAGLIGQMLLKKGMRSVGEIHLFANGFQGFVKSVWSMFTHKVIILGVILFAANTLLWLIILSGLELSYIYPMVSINYVLIALTSRIFFKEKVDKMRWLSIFIIICGVVLVSLS